MSRKDSDKKVSMDEHVAAALGPDTQEEEGNGTNRSRSGDVEGDRAGAQPGDGPGVVTHVNYANREGASTEVDLD